MFNIFINDIDKGIKCTLSKYADDIKQSGAADIWGDRMPSRGTWPTSKGEPTRLSLDLSGPSVRCYTWAGATSDINTDWEKSLRAALQKKDMGVLVSVKLDMT